jgi:16S rRNA (uracil1498-N3)-methyltransferase
MPRYDFTSQRLFVTPRLVKGARLQLDRGQSNYLVNALRLKEGATLLVFNGLDGEWRAGLQIMGRKKFELEVQSMTRPQTLPYELHYLFAPLKPSRLEYMVQKAVEMGAGVLQPVLTQHTQHHKLNIDRMNLQAKEAAEQCGILSLPEIRQPAALPQIITTLAENRQLIFCDEGEETQNPLTALASVEAGPYSVLVGPEGGFSPEERNLLKAHPRVIPIPLGPRVLRADTAAVAALAVVQAKLGDWRA